MPENAEKHPVESYDFAALRFRPHEARVTCLETNREIALRRNLCDFLRLLVEKPRETVEYREFRDRVPAWTIYKDVGQVLRTIHSTKGELVKCLRELRKDFDLIEAVPAKGYRLSADVERHAGAERRAPASAAAGAGFRPRARIAYRGHALFAAAAYAALYVIALFVEIAYRYEEYGVAAFALAGPIWLWIGASSAVGLLAGRTLAGKSLPAGLLAAAGTFAAAAFALHFWLGGLLPAEPVTEARFQTYAAQAAYLKNVFYFLGLGIFLIALPFVVVARLESAVDGPRGRRLTEALPWRPSPALLCGLTVLALLASLLLTAHLFENLKPHPRQNLFMQLVLWRWFVYFALAAECLLWYRAALLRLGGRRAAAPAISSRPAK